MTREGRIAIIGGGIGGLTAAHALRRRGFEPTIYEAAPELKEIGAGVALGPNTMKALRSLDLEQPVRDVGWESEYQILRNGISGRVISKNRRDPNLYGANAATVHRADLLDVLAADLPKDRIVLGARCVSVEQDAHVACARFRDGSEIEADIIVGADGIHSAVRESLFGADAPRFTGKVSWRFLVRADAVPNVVNSNTTWLGPHGAIVTFPVRRGELINVICHHDDDSWKEESWIRESDKSELFETYRGWNKELMPFFRAIDKPYKWAIYDRDPLPRWTNGRITILGDAAHPMLSYLGQGAGQAIEDGVVMAAAMAAQPDELPAALERYERSRLPRASQVVLASRARGEDNHLVSRWAAWRRDALIMLRKQFGSDPTGRGNAWIFEHDASSPEALVP
jgi:salicylate hydroxylase